MTETSQTMTTRVLSPNECILFHKFAMSAIQSIQTIAHHRVSHDRAPRLRELTCSLLYWMSWLTFVCFSHESFRILMLFSNDISNMNIIRMNSVTFINLSIWILPSYLASLTKNVHFLVQLNRIPGVICFQSIWIYWILSEKLQTWQHFDFITSMTVYCWVYRADSRLAPSQWDTPLQSNAVSNWLDANLESALSICNCWHVVYLISGDRHISAK